MFNHCKCSQSWNITGTFPPPWFQNWHVVFFLISIAGRNTFSIFQLNQVHQPFVLRRIKKPAATLRTNRGQFFPAWLGFDPNFGVPNDLKVSLHSKHLWPKSFFSTCELFFFWGGSLTTPKAIFVVWACHFFDVICSQKIVGWVLIGRYSFNFPPVSSNNSARSSRKR